MRFTEYLNKYKNLPRNELEVLFLYCSKITKLDLLKNPDFELSDSSFLLDLTARLEKGEPLAYLIDSAEFFGLSLKVTRDTLIPRPETEELVELAISYLPKAKSALDIGTGSGAISLALKKSLPIASVTALDISLEALKIAEQNAKNNNLEVKFCQSDLLTSIEQGAEFDLIVTNLPYIMNNDPGLAYSVAKFEPHLALFSGEQGMDHYKELFAQLRSKNIKFECLFAEFGYNQAELFQEELAKYPEFSYQISTDLQGIPRFLMLKPNGR